MINTKPFYKKHKNVNYKENKFLNSSYLFNIKFFIFHNLLPGTSIGQGIMYKKWIFTNRNRIHRGV